LLVILLGLLRDNPNFSWAVVDLERIDHHVPIFVVSGDVTL